jgi:hypothetical protein
LSRARPWIAVSVMALVVALSGLSLARDHYDVRYQREDMRAAAHFVVTHSVPEDRIVVAAEEQRLTLRYYLEHEMRRGRIIEKLPLAVVNTSEDALRSIDGWRSDGRRTWVVLSREWGEDPGHILRTALLALGPNARQAEFPGADVFVVDAVPGARAGDRTR